MGIHCQEYEQLTVEKKLLVNEYVNEWFRKIDSTCTCVPTFIFKEAEQVAIEMLKKKGDR